MAQRTGALVFDELTDRYDIRFDLNAYYGGLHCGDCLEVFVRGKGKREAHGKPLRTGLPTAFPARS